MTLSNKEFGLLRVLAGEPSRVFTKRELLEAVWGYRSPARTRTLDSHASRLRRKLDPENGRYVVNCWGYGYRLDRRMTELVQIVAGWPLVLSMAAAVAAQGLRAGRRRSALNEALHELRRPLQAVALATGPRLAGSEGAREPIELAAAALERLDREINGDPLAPVLGHGRCRGACPVGGCALAGDVCVSPRARSSCAGMPVAALVSGDRSALAQALDNLIVNAIEHGGPTIVVAGSLRDGRLRIAVVDSGRAMRPRSRRNSPAQMIARLSGRHHRGHGLGVVRRVAADHGGRFALRHCRARIARGARAAVGRVRERAGGVSRRTRAVAFLVLALVTAAAGRRHRRQLRLPGRKRLRAPATGRGRGEGA